MADFTKKAIIATFEEMLNEMAFDKITVSAIVSRCSISHNTFYYHFHDIYDLLLTWINSFIKKVAVYSGENYSWAENIKAIMHEMQNNPKATFHLFNSVSRERMEKYIFDSVENSFCDLVKEHIKSQNVSDETVQNIASFCCYSFLGFILKFVWKRMNMNIDEAVDSLKYLFDGTIEYMISNSQKTVAE